MSVVCDAVFSSKPAFGPQHSRQTSMAAGKADKEKRKRSRVTPEQLVHLERLFSVDRNPTAVRRKEIGDMLGMQERQTQIWFQNRRAKAKLQDGKMGRSSSAESPPDTPPKLTTAYEVELHNLLHEDEPVIIIPCTDLSVGTWRRIATSPKTHDLVAYLCDSKRCLTWFIHSSGHGFKMEIPFDIIVNTEFTNAAPGSGLASFILSQPPTFYLESSSSPLRTRGAEPVRLWKQCDDWTEDQQATEVLRHDLVGSTVQLAHILRHLNVHTSGSDVHRHSPSHRFHPKEPSSDVSEVHPLPLVPLAGAECHYQPQESVDLCQPRHLIPAHKHSSSPVPGQHHSLRDESVHPPFARSSGVIPEPDDPMYLQYSGQSDMEVSQSTSYSDTAQPYSDLRPPLPADRGSSETLLHGSHQRPYSAASVHSLPYENDNRIHDGAQSHGGFLPTPFGTLSLPLLTTPFYPVGSASRICTVSPYDFPIPVNLGISNSDTIS